MFEAVGSGSSTGIGVDAGREVAVKTGGSGVMVSVAVGSAAVSEGTAVSKDCCGVTAGGALQVHSASSTVLLNSRWTGLILITITHTL